MKKIFDAQQIKRIDNCTIEKQQISSFDLMERASLTVFGILDAILDIKQDIFVFAGSGNNGGDALAISRMLLSKHYRLNVYLVNPSNKLSFDCELNKNHLERLLDVNIIRNKNDIPQIPDNSVVIDGLFGSGLNRAVEGVNLDVIKAINNSCSKVYSIDMPSGMMVTDNTDIDQEQIVKADEVFTFQMPKMSLLLPESNAFCKKLTIVDIGLSQQCIDTESTDYYYLERNDASELLLSKGRFTHKGDNGRVLLVAGSFGKMGAAVLAAKACLRTGAGLLTMHVPHCGIDIMQASVPEAMVSADRLDSYISGLDDDLSKYTIGIGPGIGMQAETGLFLQRLFENYKDHAMVLDADALNLISNERELLSLIPSQSILTPHPIEFDRLYGTKALNGFQRLQNAREFAHTYNVYIVLKGAYTAIISPDKIVYFNSTGNPGMATGGSGDVLTGIVTSLLAQGYSSFHAAQLGVYLHGLAGDLVAKEIGQQSLLPSDIIDYLGAAYITIEKS